MSDHRQRGTRLRWAGLALVLAGGMLIGAVAPGFVSFFGAIVRTPDHEVPGTFEQDLDEGVYLLSFQTGTRRSVGPARFTSDRAIEVVDVAILGPDGRSLPFESRFNEYVDRNGQRFSGFATFEVEEAGIHEFRIETATPTRALVTPSLAGFPFQRALIVGVGGMAITLGLVAASVGFFDRRRTPVAAPPPARAAVAMPAPPAPPAPPGPPAG